MCYQWQRDLPDKGAPVLDKSGFDVRLCSWWEFRRRGNLETSDPYNRSDLAREIPQQWSWRTEQPLYLLRKERPEVFWKGNRKINTCYTMLNQATRVYRVLAHRDIYFEGLLISNLYLDFPSRQLLTKQRLSPSQESFSQTHRVSVQNNRKLHSNLSTRKTSQ